MHYAFRCRAHPLLFHILAEFTGVHLRASGAEALAKEARAIIDYGFDTLGAEALFAGLSPFPRSVAPIIVEIGIG
jgi:hypothetical protein